jgi:hypothetical protein
LRAFSLSLLSLGFSNMISRTSVNLRGEGKEGGREARREKARE